MKLTIQEVDRETITFWLGNNRIHFFRNDPSTKKAFFLKSDRAWDRNRVSPTILALMPKLNQETRFLRPRFLTLRSDRTKQKPGFSDNFGFDAEIKSRNPVSSTRFKFSIFACLTYPTSLPH